jgi:hypothetical protein
MLEVAIDLLTAKDAEEAGVVLLAGSFLLGAGNIPSNADL